ncbi:MAG: hypothetical protein ACI8QD_001290 [Cyclobacteriaceae bacterium]
MKARLKKGNYKVLQITISLLSLAVVGYKLFHAQFSKATLLDALLSGVPFVVFALALVPINWYLEAAKWKLLQHAHEPIPIGRAMRQVLTGLVWNWVIPFTVGDYLGRTLQSKDKRMTTFAVIINRVTSSVIAAWFGACGLLVYFFTMEADLMWLVLVGILILILTIGWLLGQYLYVKVLSLSALRYCVFALQFYILIDLLYEIEDPFWIFSGISWVFFFRTFVPSIWGAVGVRELSALLFFSCCLSDDIIILSSLSIWLINLVLPTLAMVIYQAISRDKMPN